MRRKPRGVSRKEWDLEELKSGLTFKLELECEKIERKVYEQVFAQTQDVKAAISASSAAYSDAKDAGLLEVEAKLVAFAEAQEAEEKALQQEREAERARALKRVIDFEAELRAEKKAFDEYQAELNKKYWEKHGVNK